MLIGPEYTSALLPEVTAPPSRRPWLDQEARMDPGCCAGSTRKMRPECRNQGVTLSRIRTVVEPLICAPLGCRGDRACQRIGTDGEKTTVPLSSNTEVV